MTDPTPPAPQPRPKSFTRSAILCVGIVAAMTGLAFAAPPLYDMFCRITGYGGTTQVASRAPEAVLERTVNVNFDANVAPGLALTFRPVERTQTVKLGEMSVARYVVRNTSDRDVEAIASYNVTPHKTGIFFQKLECFCFTNRVIPAGATVELPVIYFVRPDMIEDRAARDVHQITLSYTFFPVGQAPPLAPVT